MEGSDCVNFYNDEMDNRNSDEEASSRKRKRVSKLTVLIANNDHASMPGEWRRRRRRIAKKRTSGKKLTCPCRSFSSIISPSSTVPASSSSSSSSSSASTAGVESSFRKIVTFCATAKTHDGLHPVHKLLEHIVALYLNGKIRTVLDLVSHVKAKELHHLISVGEKLVALLARMDADPFSACFLLPQGGGGGIRFDPLIHRSAVLNLVVLLRRASDRLRAAVYDVLELRIDPEASTDFVLNHVRLEEEELLRVFVETHSAAELLSKQPTWDVGKAERIDRMLGRCVAHFGTRHPRTIWVMICSAEAWLEEGNLDTAVRLYRIALLTLTKFARCAHASQRTKLQAADVALSLGRALLRHRHATFQAIYEAATYAVRVYSSVLGYAHPSTLSATRLAGCVCEQFGDIENALRIFEATLDFRIAKLGSRHASTNVSYGDIARLKHRFGLNREAESIARRVLLFDVRTYGQGSRKVATTRCLLRSISNALDAGGGRAHRFLARATARQSSL
eukprot:g3724.t1